MLIDDLSTAQLNYMVREHTKMRVWNLWTIQPDMSYGEAMPLLVAKKATPVPYHGQWYCLGYVCDTYLEAGLKAYLRLVVGSNSVTLPDELL